MGGSPRGCTCAVGGHQPTTHFLWPTFLPPSINTWLQHTAQQIPCACRRAWPSLDGCACKANHRSDPHALALQITGMRARYPKRLRCKASTTTMFRRPVLAPTATGPQKLVLLTTDAYPDQRQPILAFSAQPWSLQDVKEGFRCTGHMPLRLVAYHLAA